MSKESNIAMLSKPHFAGLDLVRFFAASLVLLFHFGVVSSKLPISPNYEVVGAPDYPELSVFDIGWVGVEIFFVLSGFVIAQSADGRSAYGFLRGRASRLLPAIWLCATVTLFAVLIFGMKLLGPVFSSFLKTLIIYPNGPWISNVYWTLVVEVFFYGVVFVVLLINAFKNIEVVGAILIGLSSLYLFGTVVFGWAQIRAYFLLQHGCFFGLGILIWLCQAKGLTPMRAGLLSLAFSFCVVEICFVGNGRLNGLELWLAPFVWATALGAICISVLRPTESSQLARTLGLMTYPLYLVHEKLGSGILRIAPLTGRWLALLLAVSGVMAVSFLFVKIEGPFKRGIERSLDWWVDRYTPQSIHGPLYRKTSPVVRVPG